MPTYEMWKKTNSRALLGEPEGKRLLARHKCRWEDSIELDFKEIGLEGVDRTYWAHDRLL
jgi:hypothetical protein